MKSVLSKLGHARGFTLIELLVVIAIIGILSSVVLASLNTARSKGTDAKIQSEMRSVAVNAEIYYDNESNSYGPAADTCDEGMFAEVNPNINQIVNDLQSISGGIACNSTDTAYAIQHDLTASTTQSFCVDSTGQAKIVAATVDADATACP